MCGELLRSHKVRVFVPQEHWDKGKTSAKIHRASTIKHPLLACWPAFGSLEDAVKITQRLIRELNIP